MRKIALRGLLNHKGRLISTVLAVVLGVAFVGGVLTLTDTMNKSFDDLFGSVYEKTDAVVRSGRSLDDGFGGTARGTIDDELVSTIAAVDGVAAAQGEVEGYARIIDRDGDPVGNPSMGPPTLGGSWSEIDDLNPFNLRDGRGPAAEGEIVIDAESAKSTGYKVGDTVRVQTQDGVDDFTLVGIAGFGSADSPGGATYVSFTLAEAQKLGGRVGKVDNISVVAGPGVDQEELRAAIAAAVPDDIEVRTGIEMTDETRTEIKEQLGFVTTFLLAFALVAVLVGTFVIYNSFSIIVAQRTREMALLRAIGASRRQVRRAVLIESLAVGSIASVLGYLLGLVLGSGLSGLLALPGDSVVILPSSVITALVVGIVVTVASALIPARRAAKVPPLAAMRAVAVDTSARSRWRMIVGAVATALGLGMTVAGVASSEPTFAGLGVGALFLSVVLLGPTVAAPFSRLLGAPLARLRGTRGVLARNNAARNPGRTASTALALTIGVGIVAFFLVMHSSVRASIDQMLDESFHGDFVVDSGTFGMIGLPPSVGEQIREQPEVDLVAPVRFTVVQIDDKTTSVFASDPGAFGLLDLRVTDGSAGLAAGEIVLHADEAASKRLGVGDQVELDFLDTGPRSLTVAGIYQPASETGPNLGDYVLGLDEMEAAAPNVTDAQVFVKLAEGVSVDEAKPVLEALVDPYATAEVQSIDDFKEAVGRQVDMMLALVVGLLFLAIIIALVGIANTIALSVLERTREIGVLRAVGMSRRQLRSSIRWESVIISLLGTVLGLVVGVVGGWGLMKSLPPDQGLTVFALPGFFLAIVALVAGFLGMVAALFPAWRASRLDPLDAIHGV